MVVGCVGISYVLRVELPVQRRLCPILVRDVGSPDIHERFRGLTGSQRTPRFWGVTSSFFSIKSTGRYLAILSMADRCRAIAVCCPALCNACASCWRIPIVPHATCSCSFIGGAWDACPPSTLVGLFGRIPWPSSTLREAEPSMLILLRPTRFASESYHPLCANEMHVIHNFKIIYKQFQNRFVEPPKPRL